jgi:hypothetical protein
MLDTKTVYADNKRAPEIAEDVIAKIHALDKEESELARAMVRARIVNAERGDKREAESILKRELQDVVWHFSVAADMPGMLASSDKPELTQEFPDLRELFGQFVESRTGTAFNERFAKVFRERGDAALTQALAAGNTVTPEEDELS